MTDVLKQGMPGITKLMNVIVRIAIKELAEQSHTCRLGVAAKLFSSIEILHTLTNYNFLPNFKVSCTE